MKFLVLFGYSLALALGTGWGTAAWAEKADGKKPMAIEADALRYDDVKQVSIFTGNVLLTKGSIVIKGAQLEVRQDADGYQYGKVIGSAAHPAFFRQKREAIDEYIEGEGESLYYDGRADSVTFTAHAQLRRYRGSALADEISGGVIVYENLTDLFKVDGASPASNTSGSGSGAAGTTGRVHATLRPKPDKSDKPDTKPDSSATPAPVPQPGGAR